MSSESDILDEWAKYAESGLPLDPSADPDPVESMIGRSARINRETIERANRERQAMGAKATFSYENPTDVYRFFNRRTAAHFYTVNQVERDLIIATMPDFVYEGPAFMVSATEQVGLKPVYRFINTQTGVHLYTISEEEKDHIQANLPSYQLEGVAYFASPASGPGFKPLYRFYLQGKSQHFFTATPEERDNLVDNLCAYRYEGVGYYVLDPSAVSDPPEPNPRTVLMIVGDSLSQGYGTSINGNPYSFVSPGKVWTQRLANEIKTRTGRACNAVVNVSIGGMRTDHGSSRIQGWLDQHHPTHVILAQGTNDALQGKSLSHMVTHLTLSAQATKAAGAHVYVAEFDYYRGGSYRQPMSNMYQTVASNTQSAYYRITASVPKTSTYYHTDDVHLKDAAQPALLEATWSALVGGL